MNAGRAFDRDISRGSTGDPMIDDIWFRKKGRLNFGNLEFVILNERLSRRVH
jgi:hypothetical protein